MSKFAAILMQHTRQAVDKSSVNAVARESGVDVAALHRYLTGERSLSLTTASLLADYLGLSDKLNGRRRKK